MLRILFLVALLLSLTVFCAAQSSSRKPSANQAPPRSDQPSSMDPRSAEESSSKDRDADIRPPRDDAKNHPFSASSVAEAAGEDVQEFHPWDPHRALKDVEVGDFYFKRKNYRAAEARYREALVYKSNDAMATFGLAQCLEKLGRMDEAREKYESYLKILPEGPRAEDARKALDRLSKEQSKNNSDGK
ncbi:MAG TPA: tetratricopeptide repeat protein [Terriglobales bacterium]|jgi:tetratricopeptide (TPR) repeat protein|nr:tetratricopeptide repeat protein [Terriglobales bacterium]